MGRLHGPDFYMQNLAERELSLPRLIVYAQTRFRPVDLVMRLTPEVTKVLLDKIQKAVEKGVGVNLVLWKLSGTIGLIDTKQHGPEIKIAAYCNDKTILIRGPMQGYKGKWSHVELISPLTTLDVLTQAVKTMQDKIASLEGREI